MTIVDIKIRLNDDDPADAAILAVLLACLPGRRAAKARELMAAGLGTPPRPANGQAPRRPAAPKQLPEPAPDPPESADDDKTALERATNNFLNAFGR